MSSVLSLYRQVTRLPRGDRLFSFLFSQKAPYFATVRPRFVALRPDYAELVIPKRRRVHNHLKTVHAIAICNGLEAAMGALAEATIPPGKRWIPKGMQVHYLKKAQGSLRATASVAVPDSARGAHELHAFVAVRNGDDEVVFEADIAMWISPRAPA